MPTSFDGPTSDVDPWSDDVLLDPFPAYAALRDLGPAVRLPRYGMVALSRYDDVREALTDWQTFSSASGVGANPSARDASMLMSDPPEHTGIRRPMARQLSARRVQAEAERIEELADALVDRLLARPEIDAVGDLAVAFSLAVVGDFLGLPDADRDGLPELAERAFEAFAPPGERQRSGSAAVGAMFERLERLAHSGRLASDTRASELIELGGPGLLVGFVWPGIDTTVNALSAAVALFARHPDQWDRVRADTERVPAAFAEVLRLHSPVRYFTRRTTSDADVDGVRIPADTRVLLLYGSANRDERRYPDPDRFDLDRDASDQLAFGRGVHLCVGAHLARLEAHSLLRVLARRVRRFEPRGEPAWMINSTLHGLSRLPVALVPSA